jgi:hypothetical protein
VAPSIVRARLSGRGLSPTSQRSHCFIP